MVRRGGCRGDGAARVRRWRRRRQRPEVPGYELGALLARGGTSEVWAGVALDGGRRVAVKVVHADLGSVEAASREAAVSARAASAHVVAVEACVPLPDGRVAVVMPHLLGGAVDALVRHRGHLSPGEVVTVLAPVASALGRLHDLGVVHGDVSPGNVLLDLDGRPVLGDLGLGHVVGDVSPGVWGTDGYVAPEVLLGGRPRARHPTSTRSGRWAGCACRAPCPGRRACGPSCRAAVPGRRGLRAGGRRAGRGRVAEPRDRPGAHELAWLLFGAAEPEPLRLVAGDDEVSAVTYRLRAAAGRPPSEPASRRRRWSAAAGCRGGPPRMPAAASGSRPPRGRQGRHGNRVVHRRRAGPGARQRRWAVVRRAVRAAVAGEPLRCRPCWPLLLSLALLVLTVGRARRHRTGGHRPARPGGRHAVGTRAGASDRTARRRARPHRGAPAAHRPPPHRPATDAGRRAPGPTELLRVLADARAAAWREATPSLLGEADAPRSAVAARDAAAVAEVARAGVRYTGLRYTVAEVATVSATPDRAVLQRPHRRRRLRGHRRHRLDAARRPRPGTPVLVDLVRTDVGWRMSDLRPAP